MSKNSTKSISWRDDIDFKYYLCNDSLTIKKICSYKVYIRFGDMSIEHDYYETRHHWTNRRLEHPCWIRHFEIVKGFNSLEDFVHNRIFDSYYQANKEKLRLNPPLTKEQKEELAVKRVWSNLNWSKNNSQNGWDDYKPINLL